MASTWWAFLEGSSFAVLLYLLGPGLSAQGAPAPGSAKPELGLKAGEGLAITLGDQEVGLYGEARTEFPMGGLAELVWMRLEGAEWSARRVQYRCKGVEGTFICGNPKGHGKMDLGKALNQGCDLAFLAWIQASQNQWRQDYGEAAARARMEEIFSPFLGRRLPIGNGLPPLTPAWVGDGNLLQTSPEAFLRWLMEPDQGMVQVFGARFLAGYFSEFNALFRKEGWWFKAATAPVPGDPSATSAWVVGGKGSALVVLHLPRGRGEQEGMIRIREILERKPR